MSTNPKFSMAYNQWIADCKAELLLLGYSADQIERMSISESGTITFGGKTSTPALVIPWYDSKHYEPLTFAMSHAN
jgi:hypothetical protein